MKEPMKKQSPSPPHQSTHVLRLFIGTPSAKSDRAVKNLQKVCEEHLHGRYDLVVIDIRKEAQLAREAQIVAVPTLIKHLPLPFQRLVGDMSDLRQVLFGLGLRLRGHT